jgi:hypothetical protein
MDAGLLRRRRDFRLLVLGQAVSEAGSMLTFVAVPFQVYELTGSSLAARRAGAAPRGARRAQGRRSRALHRAQRRVRRRPGAGGRAHRLRGTRGHLRARRRGIFRSAIWNETIPDHLRGRLAGVEMISWSSGPTLGNAEAGAVAALAGVRASVIAGGVACLAGTVALALALPRFWRYDSRDAAGVRP